MFKRFWRFTKRS